MATDLRNMSIDEMIANSDEIADYFESADAGLMLWPALPEAFGGRDRWVRASGLRLALRLGLPPPRHLRAGCSRP